MAKIRKREQEAIIRSLRAGMVPRSGHQHIQVGRYPEVQALLSDLDTIADGGGAARFVIGDYGSGKTFFLHLVRALALEKKLVTVHADLTPDRRLHASGGQARALYTELVRNLSTRISSDGGALPSVIERFISLALTESKETGNTPEAVIAARLADLTTLVGGYDFAEVIRQYWIGHESGNEEMKMAATRWLRGEFTTKTDARNALGVRTIIDDHNAYDHLKLLARFVQHAGYAGLFVCLDEMVNLYKLQNKQARNSNYEQLLRILNDCVSGSAAGIGFAFGGTPEFLYDTRRGVYSYTALQSRLQESSFAHQGLVDYSGPIIQLANLTPEDLLVLLGNLRHVWAGGEEEIYLVPDVALEVFMAHCAQTIGEQYFRTPRNTIKGFLDLLAVLEQNPGATWEGLIGTVDIVTDDQGALEAAPPDDAGDDDLVSFRL